MPDQKIPMTPRGAQLLKDELKRRKEVDRFAIVKAIDHATGIHAHVRTFEVRSVTVGEDAQGEAVLTVEHNGRSYRGAGISTNILESAARAYLEVINRIEAIKASADRSRDERDLPLRTTLGPGV